MPTNSSEVHRPLPERPNVRHLKDQAKDLLKAGAAQSITEAQFKIARSYGFTSWPKLKAHVDSLEEIGELKQAIDTNDLSRVKTLMTRDPELHRAPLGYGKNGPLTWVAECRVPWAPPGPERLAMAAWMIDHGSDVHQGGDGPLMRAALRGDRIPMMELLVSRGANVNALSQPARPSRPTPGCRSYADASAVSRTHFRKHRRTPSDLARSNTVACGSGVRQCGSGKSASGSWSRRKCARDDR